VAVGAPGDPAPSKNAQARSGKMGTKSFLPFAEALVLARALQLPTTRAWEAWRRAGNRPGNVPSNPDQVYRHDGWQGWGHWLGNGNEASKKGDAVKRGFLPFAEALAFVRALQLPRAADWRAWCRSGKRPSNIPSNPDSTYKLEGWQGYNHWLGLDRQPNASTAPRPAGNTPA